MYRSPPGSTRAPWADDRERVAKMRAAAEAQRLRFMYLEKLKEESQKQSPRGDGIFSVEWIKKKFQHDVKHIKQAGKDEHRRNNGKRNWSTRSIWSIFEKKKLPSLEEESELAAPSNQSEPPSEVEPLRTSFSGAHVFSYEELNEATDGFKQQIGDGGFSSVYLGKLLDNRRVAVKVLNDGQKLVKEFINEVRVLSDIRHPNLISLYGCTDPGSQKLLLVYEFVPNGTVYDHLHGKLSPLLWAVRIRIAIETTKALSYLHSLEPPIIHRDVKTQNILLDNNLKVKVADFGMCRLMPLDTRYVTTEPRGTQGYRDPEYDLYCKLTTKSDVYSFGVVLLELITGKQAVDVYREESDIYLFRMALTKILNKELEQLTDPEVGYHSDCENKRMIDKVAELACVCLQPEANRRPSMEEVLATLKAIRDGIEPIECEPAKTE